MRDAALVTGAAGGIGLAFARKLASRGARLVLIDRDAEGLSRAARETGGEPLAVDLTEDASQELIARRLQAAGLRADWIVNCAGAGLRGGFHELDALAQESLIRLNALAPVRLIRRHLPGMLERRRGTIINVASSISFQPVPWMAVYGATKSFLLSFTEALWAECRGTGVRVLCLCPSGTDTGFQRSAGVKRIDGGRGLLAPERVVDAALRAVEADACTEIVGASGKALSLTSRVLPRRAQAALLARLMEKYR